MPESTILCIDTSEHTRNMDFGGVTRLMGITDACNLIAGAKLQINPENTIGFLTMGGSRCRVRESLTTDFDRMLASLAILRTEGTLHFVEGLRIGALALAHRSNNHGEKRLIAIVASPLCVDEDVVVKLAKKLRKEDIAVDVVNVGHEENTTVLSTLVETVNKNANSTLVQVVAPMNIPDFLLSTSIMGMHGGGSGNMGGYDYVDPNLDPELAMVLRQSAEEERLRQEALAASGGTSVLQEEGRSYPVRSDDSETQPLLATNNEDSEHGLHAVQLDEDDDEDDYEDDEDAELRLALELSRQDACPPATQNPVSQEDAITSNSSRELFRAVMQHNQREEVEAIFNEVVYSKEFLHEMAQEVEVTSEQLEEMLRRNEENAKRDVDDEQAKP